MPKHLLITFKLTIWKVLTIMKGYLKFSWSLVEVEVGRNHIMSSETQLNIGLATYNMSIMIRNANTLTLESTLFPKLVTAFRTRLVQRSKVRKSKDLHVNFASTIFFYDSYRLYTSYACVIQGPGSTSGAVARWDFPFRFLHAHVSFCYPEKETLSLFAMFWTSYHYEYS